MVHANRPFSFPVQVTVSNQIGRLDADLEVNTQQKETKSKKISMPHTFYTNTTCTVPIYNYIERYIIKHLYCTTIVYKGNSW